MEKKIIKLLNKFENEGADAKIRYWNYYQNGFHLLEYGQTYSELLMISKKYEFIKRLVENDKIDIQNLITYMNGTSLTFNKVPSTDCTNIDKIWNDFYTECLLMLLSIQDEPIEFLISILKNK